MIQSEYFADGLKEFAVESALLENVSNEPFLIQIDGTVYSIPTDEYIPVHEDKVPPRGQDLASKSSLKTRQQQTIYRRFGNPRWSVSATRKFIELLRQCGDDNEQHAFVTKREMWRYIASKMSKSGYQLDETQVENRLKSLHRVFRNSSAKDSPTKKSFVMHHFGRELHELFARKRSTTAHLFIEPLEEPIANTGDDHLDVKADYFAEYHPQEQSPGINENLMSTLEEMEDAIYTLSQKIEEESWGTEELLHEVRRLAAASGIMRKKLTERSVNGGKG
ncbi:hypothetical protein ZHAS_00004668 [Anopheles sinensis]|uniref:Myb/SANT-like DNA-binding domain-containing protein n=1 Tax=Anopheles sinensis TaxID=74873 RepID=A0A084VH66_ANOSI|nr:hypothetical protein ZHAS_00004668 [Anopheles sinensis]